MLLAKNISKSFKEAEKLTLFENLDLKVFPKETVAIMGESGVGKSTLLHILSSLEKPDTGSITIAGKTLKGNLSFIRNQCIGFIFQSFFLIESLNVLDNVLMPAKIARFKISKGSFHYNRALNLLERVGLYEKRNQLSKTLSGGEKQRTSIARALCNNPSIIFADEPTGNLDEKSSLMVQNLLLDCVKFENKTLILVTHDPEFAKRCDRTLHLTGNSLKQA